MSEGKLLIDTLNIRFISLIHYLPFYILDVPPLTDICDKIDDDDSDGWDEMEVSGEQTTCLFCPLQFLTIAVALDHCRTEHNFDLLELKTKYKMDCYSFIKMINYIRLHKPDPKEITESPVVVWDDDKYLKPGETESWLMYGKYLFCLF